MRINQFLARASGLSRRAADLAIADGRVLVAGQVATIGQSVDSDTAVTLDGTKLVAPSAPIYLVLHKPVGYVSSRAQQGSGPTVYDLLPLEYMSLRTGGRLDRDSSGLLLMSNDGDFLQRLTHPSHQKTKVYEVSLSRSLTSSDLAALERGVSLKDGISRVNVAQHDGPRATISLTEGRNRQLRRTFGALGYNVTRLHRTHIGPFELGDLLPGTWRVVHPTGSDADERQSV